MLKKILAILMALFLVSFNVSALELGVELTEGLYSFDVMPEKVAEILDITKEDLDAYCEQNGIELLAVNEGNTKQVRLTVAQTDFSLAVVNISNLTDEKILELSSDITDLSKDFCSVISLNGQKFIKAEAMSDDSGGEYILTEYTTVADKELITLSFYTAKSESTDYVEEVFIGLKSDKFINEKVENSGIYYVVLGAIIIFLIISAFIVYTIIRDLRKQKREAKENDEV